MSEPVLAAHVWATNGDLIADVARLGYLYPNALVLDPTYGRGTWWTRWKPDGPKGRLVAHDLDPAKSPDGVSRDFCELPYGDNSFDAVAFDPPYKLNGTPTADVDGRYGVHVVKSRDDRHLIIRLGIEECARVLRRGGVLLLKCQAQVNGGRVRWQDRMFADHGETAGLELVDRFDMLGHSRPQPERTRADGKPSVQQHAYGRPSTLLVFRKRS